MILCQIQKKIVLKLTFEVLKMEIITDNKIYKQLKMILAIIIFLKIKITKLSDRKHLK